MLVITLALALGSAGASDANAVNAFMDICVSSAAEPTEVDMLAARRGWRYDDSLEVTEANSGRGYYRNPAQANVLEAWGYDGLPPPEPENDGEGGGRGAARVAQLAAAAADRAADAAAVRMGRIRSREGLWEASCAIVTDASDGALKTQLRERLGFEPNAPTSDASTIWAFSRTGERLIARPEVEATPGGVLGGAARGGPLHVVSIAPMEFEGVGRRVVRYTRYHNLPRGLPTDGGATAEFDRLCLAAEGDVARARGARGANWTRSDIPGLVEGAEAYQRGQVQLFLLDGRPNTLRVQQCQIQFDGRDFEEAVDHLSRRFGPAPTIAQFGKQEWIFHGSMSQPVALALESGVSFRDALQGWVAAHGAVYGIVVRPGPSAQMMLFRYSP